MRRKGEENEQMRTLVVFGPLVMLVRHIEKDEDDG